MAENKIYNPYTDREFPSDGWIFTERLSFTDGLNNNAVSEWEKHLVAKTARIVREEILKKVDRVLLDYFSMSWSEFSTKYPNVERSKFSGLFEIRQALKSGRDIKEGEE